MELPQQGRGRVEVVCGCMFSGKSEELIRPIKRAQIARQQVQVFYSPLDSRNGSERIASHCGVTFEAAPVSEASQIVELVSASTNVVAIDEAQFFGPNIADACRELSDRDLRVIVAGLDIDFRGETFGARPRLMAEAELVTKLQAIGMACGASASRTQFLGGGRPALHDDPVILLGRARSMRRVAVSVIECPEGIAYEQL